MLRWVPSAALVLVLGLLLSGCTVRTSTIDALLRAATEPVPGQKVVGSSARPVFTVVVVNQCSGNNSVVDFWLDGTFMGTVDYQRRFTVVGQRTHTLQAQGVGPYGRTWRYAHYFGGNYYWYLC